MCIFQAAAIFGTGLVAGIFAMGTFAVHPAVFALDRAAHLSFRHQMNRRLARFMPPIMLLTVAAFIADLMLCPPSMARPLDLLATWFAVATLVITILINGPLNRRFARWTPDALPQNWTRQIRRWNFAHAFGTITSIAAFAFAILASDTGR